MFPDAPPVVAHWPYAATLQRLALALGLGLFVGLEREWRGKEAGVRTFGLTALLGCLAGLVGDAYALLSLTLIAVLVFFLNWQRLRTRESTELTTSVALLLVAFMGVVCGKGHTFTPVVVGVVAAGLLSWKEQLTTFALKLSEIELRSAILLAILTFVVYPVLPDKAIDQWGLFEPRATWATVILIAAIGFVNYLLWKLYGARGIEFTGFLGGLVNSTVAVTELATRAKEGGEAMVPTAYRGVMLSTVAMLLRNGIILGIIAPKTLRWAVIPLGLMLAVGLGAALLRAPKRDGDTPPTLHLESPFSLQAALKFGLIFLSLRVAGTLAQRFVGAAGFYAVSLLGGFVSSASSVASAATLSSHNSIAGATAANGALLASFASVLINLPLILRISGQKPLVKAVAVALGFMGIAGGAGILIQALIF